MQVANNSNQLKNAEERKSSATDNFHSSALYQGGT